MKSNIETRLVGYVTPVAWDSSNKIKEISIISNNGKVIASKSFNSSIVKWDLDLEARPGYYYVKVIQSDEDIAVTAPIWIK